MVIKRIIDIVVAGLGLLLLTPLLAVVALLVRLKLGSPILFRQVRPGLGGEPFTIYKFRTMRNAFDEQGKPLHDAERLTALGRFLRHWSLDELPELYNVLRGDMSLIGPRPLLMEYLPRYTAEQARRHDVRPGITGLAQVMGRNSLQFSQRLAYDIHYVDHFSLMLDLRIFYLTFVRAGTGRLFDGAGQDVSAVDDLGLHSGDPAVGHQSLEAYRSQAGPTTGPLSQRERGDFETNPQAPAVQRRKSA